MSASCALKRYQLALPVGWAFFCLWSGEVNAQSADNYRVIRMVDAVVNNTDATLATTDTIVDWEESIAINPVDPDEIVMLAFSGSGGPNNDAALWHTLDRGVTWSKLFVIPQPPGVGGIPNDQTLDWGLDGELSFTFLNFDAPLGNIVSVITDDPADRTAYDYNVIAGVTQLTNNLVPGSINFSDQPWILVNRTPGDPNVENAYVGYDDFNNSDGIDGPDMRVAVAVNASPLNFTLDRQVGNSTPGINPGLRLADDRANGFMYALFGRCVANCGGDPTTIDYMLNRSTDGGNTWQLEGNALGTVIATAQSTQPQPKFGGVNALLGGAHHAAVDPATGDVYYVYGDQDALGNDRLSVVRVEIDDAGEVTVSAPVTFTGAVEAALPQVAVDDRGILAIFYYTFDGLSPAPESLPRFTAHVALSDDQGATFATNDLVAFTSPVADDGNPRQRILGDYEQMKVLGNCFHGAFAANGAAFGRALSNIDPIYFEVCGEVREKLHVIAGKATARHFPHGDVKLKAVFPASSPLNLAETDVTIQHLLQEGGTELVSGLPVTLEPLPFSTANVAFYFAAGVPTISMEIIELPLLGRFTEIVAKKTAVSRPSGCKHIFGSASLTTAFTLDDGENPVVEVSDTDRWKCVGDKLVNL